MIDSVVRVRWGIRSQYSMLNKMTARNWRDATPPYLDVLQFIDMRQLVPWRTNTLQDFLHSQRGSEDSMQAPNGPAHSHELVNIDQSEAVVTAEGSLD